MSDASKPQQRLGSLGSGQDRLRGRGRGRGTLRKFAPTIAPRRTPGNTDPGNVKPAIPKLLEVAQRPEVEQKPLTKLKKMSEPAAPTTVTFVASDVKKSSSFVPNDRSLRTASAVSYSSTPSGSPLHDNDMDIDDEHTDTSGLFAPIILPFSSEGKSTDNTIFPDTEGDVIKDEKLKCSAKTPKNVKDMFQTGLRHESLNSDYIFWQLPSRLPSKVFEKKDDKDSSVQTENKSKSSKKSDDASRLVTSDARLPDGFLGKLVIYKSGKVVLKCGGVDFLVSSATQYPYTQELMALNLKTNTCNRLATVNHRVLCTPDLSNLDHQFSDLDLIT